MDAGELLEVLGNESRRKILGLLAKKPCYVSEISYCLGMAPKVVLEHLERLERAGLVSSFEEGRRRYYYISRRLRLEVTITPHRFSVEASSEDGEAIEELESVIEKLRSIESLKGETIAGISKALREVEEVRRKFAALQTALNSKIDRFIEQLLDEVERYVGDELERLVFSALAKGMRAMEIAENFRIPYTEVERVLSSLASRGLVRKEVRNGRVEWVIS